MIRKFFCTGVDQGFNYTVNELVGMWENSKKATEWHGEILNDRILQYKKSDTIFILGSGPSINSISDEDWGKISRHDSIGFNYWLVHDFIPTYYVLQLSSNEILNLLLEKIDNYKKIPIIIRGSDFAKNGINLDDVHLESLKKSDLYYINEYPISSRCSIDIDLLFRYVEALGMFDFAKICDFVPKWRGTLGLLISLSYQMGYKNIVLCGMDMQDADHFWDYPPYETMKEQYNLPDIGKANIKTFTDDKHSPNTVPRYVYALRDWMKEKADVKLFIYDENTVLHSELEIFKFGNND